MGPVDGCQGGDGEPTGSEPERSEGVGAADNPMRWGFIFDDHIDRQSNLERLGVVARRWHLKNDQNIPSQATIGRLSNGGKNLSISPGLNV